jgi:CheY-like chemotaxis protein
MSLSSGSDAATVRAQMAGFDDHLMKPVEPLALQQALAGFVPVKGQ